MCTHPSASSHPMSPVRYQPSRNAAAVAASGRYPSIARRAQHLDLTGLARWQHRAVVGIGDPHLHAGDGEPRAVETPRSGCVHRVGGDHRDLAGAVGGEPRHAGAAGDGARHLLGDRRRAPHHVAQRAEVVGLEARVVGHPERDRRDGHLEREAVVGDRAQRRVEVEPRVEPDARAGVDGGDDVEQSEDVHGRCRHLEPVVVGEPERGHSSARPRARGTGGCAAPPSASRWCRS